MFYYGGKTDEIQKIEGVINSADQQKICYRNKYKFRCEILFKSVKNMDSNIETAQIVFLSFIAASFVGKFRMGSICTEQCGQVCLIRCSRFYGTKSASL